MKNILKKCIEELAKESPKQDYIRGMLEVLVEQEPEKPAVQPTAFTPSVITSPVAVPNANVNPHGMPANDAFKVLSDNPIENV